MTLHDDDNDDSKFKHLLPCTVSSTVYTLSYFSQQPTGSVRDLYCMWWGQHLNLVDYMGVGELVFVMDTVVTLCITKLLVATPTCIGLNRGFASLYN